MTEKLKRKLRKDARQWWFQTTNISLDNLVEELLVFLIEPREKRIEELEAQIEKMKNCNNCGNYYTESCKGCENYCNWKLKEQEK